VHIDLRGVDAQQVTVINGDDQLVGRRRAGTQRLAQRDVDLHGLGGRRRRILAPQRLDQPIDRDHLAGRQQQHRKHGALLVRPERERLAVLHDLQITEGSELHVCAPSMRCADRTTSGEWSRRLR
jgi:hypothetical protein